MVQWPTLKIFDVEGLKHYASIGIPAALMLCIEWWAFEITVILAGYMSITDQASQTIFFTCLTAFS